MKVFAIVRNVNEIKKEYFCLVLKETQRLVQFTCVRHQAIFYKKDELEYAITIAKDHHPDFQIVEVNQLKVGRPIRSENYKY